MLNPIEITQKLKEAYISYITTTFPIKDRHLLEDFKSQLEKDIIKDPILEITPEFETGCNIEELISEGVLSDEFRKLGSEAIDIKRPLYKHQEIAIRKAVNDKKNIVVSTGTGSGKTLTYFIPIINELMRAVVEKRLTSGVKTLLLYPMNALADDQLSTLRRLLQNYSYITFGAYTGNTEELKKYAEKKFEEIYRGEKRIKNELISREEIRVTPPHILITNYSMLEYLLLRPKDSSIFEGGNWSSIILDELHMYDGAKGIEISLLLRRLKERVNKNVGLLQCFGTSATMGGERDKIALFASTIFAEKFDEDDVINAYKRHIDTAYETQIDIDFYIEANKIINDNEKDDLKNINDIKKLFNKYNISINLADASQENELPIFLYKIFSKDKLIQVIRRLISDGYKKIDETLANDLNNDLNYKKKLEKENLIDIINISSKARKNAISNSLIPARYHTFMKSLEGLYYSPGSKKLYINRKKYDENEFRVFEAATCSFCGIMYLIGVVIKDHLEFPENQYIENNRDVEYFLLMDKTNTKDDLERIEDNDEKEEFNLEELINDNNYNDETYDLNMRTGELKRATQYSGDLFTNPSEIIQIVRVKKGKGNIVRYCQSCGKRSTNSIVRRFLTTQEAPITVIASTVFSNIPPRIKDDREIRQILMFSDSRQKAAYLSYYVGDTHYEILKKRVIYETLLTYVDDKNVNSSNPIKIEDVVDLAHHVFNQNCVQSLDDENEKVKIKDIWNWFAYELLDYERRNSLKGLGILDFRLIKPNDLVIPNDFVLKKDYNLSDIEIFEVINILFKCFYERKAVSFPPMFVNVDAPKVESYFPYPPNLWVMRNGNNTTQNMKCISFLPLSDSPTERKSYIKKLRIQTSYKGNNSEKFDLEKIWDFVLSQFNSYFEQRGSSYRLRHNYIEMIFNYNKREYFFICDSCKKVTTSNVKNICTTMNCQGHLRTLTKEDFKDNHYYQLYTSSKLIKMKTEEHTAQLTVEKASDIGYRFKQGKINLLSSSTTFEVGVDIGDLEVVLMTNIPPSPSNYIQRAGRSGRPNSQDLSVAYVVSYAQRRSHDLYYYQRPEEMVSGRIKPPFIEISNEKMIRRHIHSIAFSYFWRQHPEYFGDINTFFRFYNDNTNLKVLNENSEGMLKFKDFLKSRPKELEQSIEKSFGEIINNQEDLKADFKDWNWITPIINSNSDEYIHELNKSYISLKDTVKELHEKMCKFSEDGNYQKAASIQRILNTLLFSQGERTFRNDIINFFAKEGVFPKFGFPVDLVSLEINSDARNEVNLSRDLKIAISEYAPGSKIIANGKLWKSYAIKKLSGKEWRIYKFYKCTSEKCNAYNIYLEKSMNDEDKLCKYCHAKLVESSENSGDFLIPEFGFSTKIGYSPEKIGDNRPERAYSIRTEFTADGSSIKTGSFDINGYDVKFDAMRSGELFVMTSTKFWVCKKCGFADKLENIKTHSFNHKTISDYDCNTALSLIRFGHIFKTDVLKLSFELLPDDLISLAYAIKNAATLILNMNERDINVTFSFYDRNIILYDDFPGGAKQVHRIIQEQNILMELLEKAYNIVSGTCGCKEDTSCYGCLRSYVNEIYHPQLNRGNVKRYLSLLLNKEIIVK